MMPAPDPAYVAARRVLLDALQALHVHLDAIIVVGAQAIYLRTGTADVAVAPLTTDADLALDPRSLAERPELEAMMSRAGFHRDPLVAAGSWMTTTIINGQPMTVPVDLMVPTTAAPPGSGRRSVNLPGHDPRATRQAAGLEAALIDNDTMRIGSLEDSDTRGFDVKVAGPTALIIAKVHKIAERITAKKEHRISAKDAGDVYRLMLATPTDTVITVLRLLLDDDRSAAATRHGLDQLNDLFGARLRPGVQLAVQALDPAIPSARVEAVSAAFVRDIRAARIELQ
jgi:hypothetical protein